MNVHAHRALFGAIAVFCILASADIAASQSFISIEVAPANPTISVGQPKLFTATGLLSDGSTGLGWSTRAPMPTPRYGFAVGVVNGVVYAVGGVNGRELDTVEAYDAATDTWTDKAPMPTARFILGVGVVNGILYAVGGEGLGSSSTVEAYDPATDTWTTKAPLPEGRAYHAVGIVDDVLYVVGGGGPGNHSLFAYDPAADTWATKAELPNGPRLDLAVGVVNGILYAVGGIGAENGEYGIVEAYDPTTDTWTTKASLPTGRAGLAIGVVNGILYAVGGICAECESFAGLVEVYDPATDAWGTGGPLPTPRGNLGVAVVNDTLYAVGGAGPDVESVVEAYGPLKVIWSSSNPEVAIVGANGQAVGLSPGTTTITARSGSLSGDAVLTVAPTNTTAGTNVTVPLSPGDIIITFDSVSEPGNTTATTSTSVPPPTQGLSLDTAIYDIQTTAAFTGPVVICLPYSAGTDPAKLSLLRYENDTWTDVTTFRDTTNRLICGQVMSLSPLALGRLAGLANTAWPMFRHDRQHTGRSTYTGPGVPARKWAYVMAQYVNFSPSSPAVGADGTIYAISYNEYSDEPTDPSTRNQLHAVGPDGMLKWKFQLDPNGIIDSSPAVSSDGTIYVTSWAPSRLYAVNPDGTLQWIFADDQMTGCISSSPAIGPDGTIYSGGDGLCAFNPNGTLKWVVNLDRVYTAPAVGTDGTIYILGRNAIFAVNPDGTLKWSFESVEFDLVAPVGPAVGTDGTIYVGALDGNLYAVNPDGTLNWTFPTGAFIDSSPAVGADGTIYVNSRDGNLYAVNPDGTMKWSVAIDGCRCDPSPTVGADGTIYMSSFPKVFAVTPSGAIKWSFTGDNDNFGPMSSAVIGGDGLLYVVFDDGKLYAIGEGNTPTGTDVPVDLGGGTSVPGAGSVTFSTVTSGGDTALTSGATGPAPPVGFMLGDPPTYYDVTTTAAFDGPATVCINYSGIGYQSESGLKLFHLEDGAWVDRTVSLDTGANVICATVSSFSPFAILEVAGTSLTALTPAKLWVGLANSDSAGLRLDLKAELFVNSTSNPPVATGTVNNVSGGSSGYGNAVLNTITLALTNGPVRLVPGGHLLLQVSVRRTCTGAGHASGMVRFWYNGAAVDSGTKRDAASRFGAVVGGAAVNYYLRAGSALETTPGSSRLSIDKLVNSATGCPNRPYTPLGTWSATP